MPQISINDFLQKYRDALDNRNDTQSKWILKNPYPVLAVEYLENAITLINNNPTRLQRIDVITNIKRAVHRRTDTLLYVYWLQNRSSHYRWNFPQKYNALKNINVIYRDSKNQIKTINRLRNPVEHNYENAPSVERLNTLISLTNYFLRVTTIYLFTPERIVYPPDNLIFLFDLDNNRISIQQNNIEIEYVRSSHSSEWEILAPMLFSDNLRNHLAILDRLCSCGYDPFIGVI